jgi:tetratricopeptide (TPR) repeat protein
MPQGTLPRRLLYSVLLLHLLLAIPRAKADDDHQATAQANIALQQGRVDNAASILETNLSAQPNNAFAHQLLCRVYYAQDMAERAIHECELAVAADPNSSENHLWLGRAYGMKASKANPVFAFSLARKVRDEFELAVKLDPQAPRAASDLGEYYISAPSIVGGGTDKAQALIARIEPRFPMYSHRLRAMLAEKNGDLIAAEKEFKIAISVSSNAPPAWIDLAAFYQRHAKPNQAIAAIQSGLASSPQDAVLVDAASILTDAKRSPDLAEHLLVDYLNSPAKTDEAPAFKIHLRLGQLLARRGDTAGARAHFAAALAMASSYPPARKAVQGS